MTAAPARRLGPGDPVAEAMRLVGDDPARAVAVASDLITGSTGAALSHAHRARGLAHRELGDLDAALEDLRAAVQIAEEANARRVAAEARMSLVSVLAERGEMRAALAESDRAAAELTGLPAARMRVQRGTFLCRVGQFTAALDEFTRALPVLRRHGDGPWEARALNNRGGVRVYQGAFAEAAEDFRRAEQLFLASGRPLHAADAGWNLGICAARLGDVPRALAHFDTAELRYAHNGVPATEIFLGRCNLLLSVGLHAEAVANAEHALDQAGDALRAEAHLALARASLARGDHARAADAARHAADLFATQDRPSWTAVARYVMLRTAKPGPDSLQEALRTADELARAGWGAQELDARIIAARFAVDQDDTACAREQLQRASNAKSSGTMATRARAWHAEALLRLRDGDRDGAEEALRTGLDAIDQHRAALGATELRVHTAVHGEELASLGMELALADGDPHKVLGWAERWRAGALRWRPVRPPDDAELAALLAELRHVAGREEQERLDGEDARACRQQRQALERQLVDRARRRSGPFGLASATVDAAELARVLGSRVLVEYLAVDGELMAITVTAGSTGTGGEGPADSDAGGRGGAAGSDAEGRGAADAGGSTGGGGGDVRLHRLGPVAAATRALDQVIFALRGLACSTNPAARELLGTVARALDGILLRPVRDVIGDAELVLVPSAALRAVPWAALPNCAGRAVSVVPSATVWVRAHGRPAASGQVTVVGGPGLDGGDAEAANLATVYPGSTLLRGPDASAAAVLAALDGARIAHIAAHGTVRADNPFFSALQVADGPLTVFDLERLETPPELVVLPACQSGVTVARPGDEVLGLAAALLALGSRCLVACVVPVPDRGAEQLMTLLHERLRAGDRPAQALAAAQSTLRASDDPEVAAAAAAFACFGAG